VATTFEFGNPQTVTGLILERRSARVVVVLACLGSTLTGCTEREEATEAPPAASVGATTADATAEAGDGAVNKPDEIYFDLTAFPWYREGRPLMHAGRPYMPQAEPTTVEVRLREAGRYEGVAYYVAEGTHEPVYTLYVPVYYRYWQRFTSPPGS
jgi:hypothetical protein